MSIIPDSVPTGAIRYNTDSNKMECWIGDKWMQISVSESAPTSGRGIVGGGDGASNIIQYNTIETTGNSIDFGDLDTGVDWPAAVGSRTRGVFGGGRTPTNIDKLQTITIASTGNATDGGNLTSAKREMGGCSDQTRGCYGGETLGGSDDIDYITIASDGNALDFGNLVQALDGAASFASSTRGIWAGGEGPSPYPGLNIIQFVTIQSTGNAVDFGDLTVSKWGVFGSSSPTRGIVGGNGNVISFITIATTGNAEDFGDLTGSTQCCGSAFSSPIRGVFVNGGTPNNDMEFVNFATKGNGTDFGDTIWNVTRAAGLSNSHGGLQKPIRYAILNRNRNNSFDNNV